jgi:hypothetical protein
MVQGMSGRAARYLWAAPASLVGLVLGMLIVACGGSARLVDGVLEGQGGTLGRALQRWGCPFVAITFGHVVLAIDGAVCDACRAHERVHVRQYERWGALFFVAYVASSVRVALRGGHPYRDNAFEREARRLAA